MPNPLLSQLGRRFSDPRVQALANVVSACAAALSTYFAYDAVHLSKEQQEIAFKVQALEWRPELSLILTQAPIGEESTPLGLFLENVGKGPARVERACLATASGPVRPEPVADAADQAGLSLVLGTPSPGDTISSGEKVPILAFRPSAGLGWSEGGSTWVADVMRQLQVQKKLDVTVCYASLLDPRHCLSSRRQLRGDDWLQERAADCDNPCCSPHGPAR